jgi:ABC-type multidrug transport system fused ATPase/permease subunit
MKVVSNTRPTGPLLPRTIFGYILHCSGRHQLALAALSVIVFLLTTVPLELQRRIINDAIYRHDVADVLWLAAAYGAVALTEGVVKLGMNIYRGWVGENAVRHLRKTIYSNLQPLSGASSAEAEGVEVSLVLSEVEPIGGFVGVSTSEPLLQGGILLSVFGYMIYLQPEIAAVSLLVFSPQFVFVPLLQHAIIHRSASRIRVLREISGDIINGVAHDGDHETAQESRIERVFALNMGIYKLKFSMNFLMNLMHHLGIVAVLAVGGWYAATGRIEVGTVVAFISGLAKLNDPWGDVVNWFRDATSNGIKYRLVADALERLRVPIPVPQDARAARG